VLGAVLGRGAAVGAGDGDGDGAAGTGPGAEAETDGVVTDAAGTVAVVVLLTGAGSVVPLAAVVPGAVPSDRADWAEAPARASTVGLLALDEQPAAMSVRPTAPARIQWWRGGRCIGSANHGSSGLS